MASQNREEIKLSRRVLLMFSVENIQENKIRLETVENKDKDF